jgi:hypothetical protein
MIESLFLFFFSMQKVGLKKRKENHQRKMAGLEPNLSSVWSEPMLLPTKPNNLKNFFVPSMIFKPRGRTEWIPLYFFHLPQIFLFFSFLNFFFFFFVLFFTFFPFLSVDICLFSSFSPPYMSLFFFL